MPASSRQTPPRLARVESVAPLTPHLVRIVFGGEGLRGFEAGEFSDGYVKLMFPREGGRTRVRTYTVSDWDGERGLLTVDFVVHGTGGVAGPWAAAAKPGDLLQLRGPGGGYSPDPEADWHLMAGDACVIPAISNSLARVPAGRPVHVFLQVAGPGEEVELASPGDLRLHLLHGGGEGALAEALASLEFPPGRVGVFLHGEATAVRLARRHLVVERGVPTEGLSVSGYWKRASEDEAWREEKREWNELVAAEAG